MRNHLANPTGYLRAAGGVLTATGVIAIVALLTGTNGFVAYDLVTLDYALGAAHIVVGAVALAIASDRLPRVPALGAARGIGLGTLAIGIAGFLSAGILAPLGIGLELVENVLHVLLGLTGLAVGFAAALLPAQREASTTATGQRSDARVAEAVEPMAWPRPTERNQDIEAVEGIGPVYGKKLRAAGIATAEQLLDADPASVARDSGIDASQVQKWHWMIQLQAVNGIGKQYSELLVRCDVQGLRGLAGQKPAALARAVNDYEAGLEVRVQGGAVTAKKTGAWIRQAKAHVRKGLPAEAGSDEAAKRRPRVVVRTT